MTDAALIALCVGAFAAATWLLGISFVLGRYAARVDSLTRTFSEFDAKFTKIFDKLDGLSMVAQHHCIQVERITRIEATIDHNRLPAQPV